ncbi:MAG: hypothetical protein AAF514_04590 [Verrucomicrobiota bacterium]
MAKRFGKAPHLRPGVNDLSGCLNRRQVQKLTDRLVFLGKQFPQLRFHVVYDAIKSGVDLGDYAFWIFNSAELCRELDKGALNFHVLTVIDSKHQRAGMCIGYGLEPFLGPERMEKILLEGLSSLEAGHFLESAEEILSAADEHLIEIANGIPRTYGLKEKKTGQALPA